MVVFLIPPTTNQLHDEIQMPSTDENRDENQKLLKQKKSLIIKQISAAKSKVLKYLDEIEERLITEVESVQEKNYMMRSKCLPPQMPFSTFCA
jgi:hypothetical protein